MKFPFIADMLFAIMAIETLFSTKYSRYANIMSIVKGYFAADAEAHKISK